MKVRFEEQLSLEDELIVMKAKKKTTEINTLIEQIEKTKTVLQGTVQGKNYVIPCRNFIRFYSANKKVYGVTSTTEYTLHYRLYELENLLQKNFIRISNTEIINSHCIKELKLTSSGIVIICFKNGTQTSSSRRYLKHIKESLFL